MTDLDATDRLLLDLLRADGRARLAPLADQVGLSISAVKRRINRLEQAGVIVGYTARIDESRIGPMLEAFTELRFAGDARVADIKGVAAGMSEVQAVFTTAGDPDALVWIRVKDINELTRVIDQLRRSGAVTGTKTLMVLDTWKGPGAP